MRRHVPGATAAARIHRQSIVDFFAASAEEPPAPLGMFARLGVVMAIALCFGLAAQRRFAELQAIDVLVGEVFDFDREPHGAAQVVADRDHAVMCEKAGFPVLQRLDGVVGEFLRAEGRVRRAADRVAAGRAEM